ITVTNTANTEIIKVNVEDPDKALAADIANELIKVFGEEIKEIYRLQNVSIVDVAEEAEYPYNVNIIKDIVIYLLVGIVLACGLIFVIYYFDTTIKSADEVEKKLGLPVFGIVPRVKYKEKR
ncbi:MAG: capsular biosynthesis protein, partial [Bacilli bacterium]|nr:capsular biosynthesis protein [Bacilli bacterium]